MGLKKLRWHIAKRDPEWEAEYIDIIIKHFEKKFGEEYRKILDLACGYGRLHPFLIERGYEIVGVELSDELIEESRKNNPNVKYIHMDIREIDFEGEFDVVLSWFTSLFYFSDEENKKLITKISKALRKGGLFILDHAVWSPEWKSFFSIQEDENYVVIDKCWIEGNVWNLLQRAYRKEGQNLIFLKERTTKVTLYKVEEIKQMLEENSFEILKIFERYSIRDYKRGRSAIFVARKI